MPAASAAPQELSRTTERVGLEPPRSAVGMSALCQKRTLHQRLHRRSHFAAYSATGQAGSLASRSRYLVFLGTAPPLRRCRIRPAGFCASETRSRQWPWTARRFPAPAQIRGHTDSKSCNASHCGSIPTRCRRDSAIGREGNGLLRTRAAFALGCAMAATGRLQGEIGIQAAPKQPAPAA